MSAYSYNFTGTNGNPWDAGVFTEVSGSVNIQSNEGNFESSGFGLDCVTYTGATVSTVDQYQKYEYRNAPSLTFLQAGFRYTNSSSPFYTVESEVPNEVFSWYHWANLAAFVAGSSTLIQSVTIGGVGAAGNTWGWTLFGTGTNTRVCGWKNPTGDTPTAGDNWGGDTSPTVDFTNNPASAVDTGTTLLMGNFQSAAGFRMDNLFWGDIGGGAPAFLSRFNKPTLQAIKRSNSY